MKKDFFKEYGFRILFVVFFLLAFVWMGTKQTILSNSNSAEDWLPAQYQQTRDYKWYLECFPFESYVVVSWDGCEMDDDRIELFAQKLVPDQTIDNFSLGASSEAFVADMQLRQEPRGVKEKIDAAAGEPTNVSTQALVAASGSENEQAQAEKPQNENYFKSVMTGPRLARLLQQTYEKMERRNSRNHKEEDVDENGLTKTERNIRERLKGTLIGPDGKSTAMIITLNKGKRNGKALQRVLQRIRDLSVESGLPNTTKIQTGSVASRMVQNLADMFDEMAHGRKVRMDGVILGGPPVDNVALDQEGERTLFRLAGICAVVGVVIAFICLRSIRLTLFVFWIAALSAGLAMALVSLTGGTCDSILLSMPALVYVLGLSGAVHLINYYHDAIREHGLDGATERAVRHAFTPCFFAQLTTAIGLGSLFVGRLVPITKFGFYSAIGVLLTLLLLFLYLPAMLYYYPSKKFAAKHGGKGLELTRGRIERGWDVIGGFIIKRHNWVLVFCFGLMLFFGVYLDKIKTSVKMMSFFSPDADIIQNYTWLEDKLGPLVPMELVVCFDNSKQPQSALRTSERLELINRIGTKLKTELSEDVGGTLSVALFAPDAGEVVSPGGAAYRTVATVVGKTVDDNRDALRDYLTVEGNPDLQELGAFLAERRTQKRDEAERRVEEFNAALNADPNVKDRALDYDSFVADEEKQFAQDEFLALYCAKFDSIQLVQEEAQKAERAAGVFADNIDYFQDQDIGDLRALLDATKREYSLRKLIPDDVALLREGAEAWERERGVELWRVSIRVWSLKKDIDYSAFIENVKNVVEPMLAEASLTATTTLETIANPETENADAASLAENAVQAKLNEARRYVAENLPPDDASDRVKRNAKDEKTLLREFTLAELSDEERAELQYSMGETHLNDWIYPAGLAAKYTGMVPLVYTTQHELINGLTSSLVMAFVLIMLVFVFILRSIPAGFIAMIPNIFPVVVVFGYMSFAGVLVDVGTMMTASVALGVAVDDTMHYLTWFSDGIAKGMDPKEAALNAYRRCAPAMTESSLIAGLGLFSFAFSTFVPTQRFGILMLAILATAEFGDLVFLPALLTCKPFGKFFIKRRFGLKQTKNDDRKAAKDAEARADA